MGVQRERLPLGERKALLMRSVKSAFALLLARVTDPTACAVKKEVDSHEKNYKRYGRQRLGQSQQPEIQSG